MGEAMAAVRDYRRRDAGVGSTPCRSVRSLPPGARPGALSRSPFSGDDAVRAAG
jgi:hypothetical protein